MAVAVGLSGHSLFPCNVSGRPIFREIRDIRERSLCEKAARARKPKEPFTGEKGRTKRGVKESQAKLRPASQRAVSEAKH